MFCRSCGALTDMAVLRDTCRTFWFDCFLGFKVYLCVFSEENDVQRVNIKWIWCVYRAWRYFQCVIEEDSAFRWQLKRRNLSPVSCGSQSTQHFYCFCSSYATCYVTIILFHMVSQPLGGGHFAFLCILWRLKPCPHTFLQNEYFLSMFWPLPHIQNVFLGS